MGYGKFVGAADLTKRSLPSAKADQGTARPLRAFPTARSSRNALKMIPVAPVDFSCLLSDDDHRARAATETRVQIAPVMFI
jgi:hypothetical protein